LVLKTLLNCIHEDIMNRVTTKPPSSFNQRPYLRLIVFLLFELSEITFFCQDLYPFILLIFGQFLNSLRPQTCPQFIFSWMQLLSHSKFMPKILKSTNYEKYKEDDEDEDALCDGEEDGDYDDDDAESQRSEIMKECKTVFHDLLMSLLQFVDPFWRSPKSPPSVCLLFQGTLRILLVLLHDFPSFLCEYHYSFCQNIPISSFQMRNLVLSAFPKDTKLPDPFQPNLNLQTISAMEHEPKISSNYMKYVGSHKKLLIDQYLSSNNSNNKANVNEIALSLKTANNDDDNGDNYGFIIQYNLKLVNSIIVYLASQKQSKNAKCLDLIYCLALELDSEGRYHLFNAVCNNLRYPNSHTKFCSAAILFMFQKSNVLIKEQITRILLERLVVHRPHPWGLLITFIQLIKQPEYKFWDEPFTRCAPEIESLFQTVASSCFRVFN